MLSVEPAAHGAVSAISWAETSEANRVAVETLHSEGLTTIHTAPGIVVPNIKERGLTDINPDDVSDYLKTLRVSSETYDGPMRVAALQAITYGCPPEYSIFSENHEHSDALREHIAGSIVLANMLGAKAIIYGGGGTRITEGLTSEQIEERAMAFFQPLSEVARDNDVVLGIEPVSTTYTQDRRVFGRTGAELLHFVAGIQSGFLEPTVRVAVDSFALHDGDGKSVMLDAVRSVISRASRTELLLNHAQMSEPGMQRPTLDSPLKSTHKQIDWTLAYEFKRQRTRDLHTGNDDMPTIAVEMRKPGDNEDLATVLRGVVGAMRHHYAEVLGTAA